jgi:hypothetical protein
MKNKPDWGSALHDIAAKENKRTKAEAKTERDKLLAIIGEQSRQLETALAIADAPKAKTLKQVATSDGNSEAVAFAIASDWHVEETVDPKTVNGLNEFSLNIAEQRIERFFRNVVKLTEVQRHGAKIDTLVLALLGDLMTGYIHEELRETNGLSPTETVLWLVERVGAGIKFLEPHFGRLVIPTSHGNHGRCHDAETEILTLDGWKKFNGISKGDLVATFNVESGNQEWQPLLDVYVNHDYDDDLIYVKNNSVDFAVTPNHRMLLESVENRGRRKFMEVQDMDRNTCGHWFLPKRATNPLPDYDGVTDDELRLIGWIWTDGSIGRQRGKSSYRIHQSKPETCQEIRELLSRMGLEYGELVRDRPLNTISGVRCLTRRPDSTFTISAKHRGRMEELLLEKPYLPEWFHSLSARQVGVFLEAVKSGDGTPGKNPDGHYEIYGRPECLDILQSLLIVNGISTRIRTDKRGHGVLSVRSSATTVIQRGTWDSVVQRKAYTGTVWCGTVENGTLITRRNGIPLISGNSTMKPRHATGARNSYEWMLYQILKKQFPQHDWQIADGYHNYLEVDGRVVRFHHGDDLKYQGGVGGLTIPVLKAIAQWNKAIPAYLDVFGHWHQSMQNPSFVANSSLIGHNAYAIAIKAGFESPTQTFFLMDKKRGRTITAPIFVD